MKPHAVRAGDLAIVLLALTDMPAVLALRPRVSTAAALVLDALRELPDHARYDLAGAVRLTWLLSFEITHSKTISRAQEALLSDAEALVVAVEERVRRLERRAA